MNDDIRNVLRIAKGYIAESWGRGRGSEPPRDSHCLVTAIVKASWPDQKLGRAARDTVRAILGGPLHVWNDAPGRTQAEVIALIDKVLADEPTPKLRERTEMIEGVLV